MKYLIFFFVVSSLFSCSGSDKNPLVIPQENVGNQENIDKLKKMLQESD